MDNNQRPYGTIDEQRTQLRNWIVRNEHDIALLLWGILIGFLLAVVVFNSKLLSSEFIDSLGSTAVGILITVLVIDVLNRRSEHRQYKWRLIHEMRTRSPEFSSFAIDLLREEGELTSGELRGYSFNDAKQSGANLRDADLQNATFIYAELDNVDLSNANLTHTAFTCANLENAKLWNADLSGARLERAVLIGAKGLEKTIIDENTVLPDGTKWFEGCDLSRFTNPNHDDFYESQRYINGHKIVIANYSRYGDGSVWG